MGVLVMTGYDWNTFLNNKSFWENRKCEDVEIYVDNKATYAYLSPVRHGDSIVKIISGKIFTVDTKEYVCTLSDLAKTWGRKNAKYMCTMSDLHKEELVNITISADTVTATELLSTILNTNNIKSFRVEKNTRG